MEYGMECGVAYGIECGVVYGMEYGMAYEMMLFVAVIGYRVRIMK